MPFILCDIPPTYRVKDSTGKVRDYVYYTRYHAEQMARALNLNEGTYYRMYHGTDRFYVSL